MATKQQHPSSFFVFFSSLCLSPSPLFFGFAFLFAFPLKHALCDECDRISTRTVLLPFRPTSFLSFARRVFICSITMCCFVHEKSTVLWQFSGGKQNVLRWCFYRGNSRVPSGARKYLHSPLNRLFYALPACFDRSTGKFHLYEKSSSIDSPSIHLPWVEYSWDETRWK